MQKRDCTELRQVHLNLEASTARFTAIMNLIRDKYSSKISEKKTPDEARYIEAAIDAIERAAAISNVVITYGLGNFTRQENFQRQD